MEMIIEGNDYYMGSRILDYINEKPDWENEFNRRCIRTNRRGNLVCFKYAIEADFSDPIVCEARGIIIDVEKKKVVCWPFDKFFNVQERYAAKIDWDSARVLEKIDGSLIKMYWYEDKWVFATSSTCDATDAVVAGFKGITYYDVITKSDNYGKIPFDSLDKGYTYLFELVSPMTQVVIKYDITTLFYLASRENNTGKEVDYVLEGFRKPRRFPLRSVDECIKAAKELNADPEVDMKDEGFVVVDKDHRRIKVKSPAYIALHRTVTNKVFTSKRMIDLYLRGTDLTRLARDFPNDAYIIKYYDWQFEEVRHKIAEMAGYAVALYKEYDYDRRAVASVIKDSPYAWAGFAAIDNDKNVEELMGMLNASKLGKLVAEYSFEK